MLEHLPFCTIPAGMPNWQLASIIVSVILVYAFIGGVTIELLPEAEGAEIIISIFWPIILPGILGILLVKYITRPKLPKAIVSE